MSLKSDMVADLNVIMDGTETAYTSTFTRLDGSVVPGVLILIDRDQVLQPGQYDAQVAELGTVVTCLHSVTGEPKQGDTFTVTVSGEVFTAQRIQENDGTFVEVVVT